MLKFKTALLTATVLGISCFTFAGTTPDHPGKTAFVASKCNVCHAVATEGVEKKGPASTAKKVPPDLSGIGATRTADWLEKFIAKKEAKDGVKHVKAWTGKDEDLKSISKWLESLKTPKK